MNELGVTLVYNADQTAVFFEMLPSTTVAERRKNTVWIRNSGKDKDQLQLCF
jgi:hypothetical protein